MLRELYTVGRGPSSSHTIGPTRACCLFREEHPDADRYEVALFGSLRPDRARPSDRRRRARRACAIAHRHPLEHGAHRPAAPEHDGAARLQKRRAHRRNDGPLRRRRRDLHPRPARHRVAGGLSGNELRGDLRLLQRKPAAAERLCVFLREGEDIRDYLYDIWNTMKQSVSDGLTPAPANCRADWRVERKAQYLYNRRHIDESPQTREKPARVRVCVRRSRAERLRRGDRHGADVRRERRYARGAPLYAGGARLLR